MTGGGRDVVASEDLFLRDRLKRLLALMAHIQLMHESTYLAKWRTTPTLSGGS